MTILRSRQIVCFSVDGVLLYQGYDGRSFNCDEGISRENYWQMFRTAAVFATKYQKWKLTSKPVYVVIKIYQGQYFTKESMAAPDIDKLSPKGAALPKTVWRITKALEGILYKSDRQIVGLQVSREYEFTKPRVEVVVGIPARWEDLVHDLSETERPFTELESDEEEPDVQL